MTETTNKNPRFSQELAQKLEKIPDRLFFRIGDVADLLGVKPHVLRYWESEFSIVSPQKSATGQRIYRRKDVEALMLIRHLLHEERYSIEGARKKIKEMRKEGLRIGSVHLQHAADSADDADKAPRAASGDAAPIEAPALAMNGTSLAGRPSPSAAPASSLGDRERNRKIRELARELKELSRMPLNELFP